ncbi:phenylacetate--CoA ligase family protein [Vibrio genomosp. F6]|uniref:phenylacetate--CoA ligase family protein n=1 Tax=Vibrio genomosp. F6 TaxID=723172 RepID=UPI0010BD9F37|nr:phenylacetate--CoA ligase family protein [Vibrio genomosp. F6]TKF22568.1 phenylacetate--CoA ligase family protein [Vibrio genomosp. F6]
MFLSGIYINSPIFVQNTLLSVRALIRVVIREGKSQQGLTKKLLAHDKNLNQLKKYSELELNSVIKKSETVPTYKNSKLESDGLESFPVISKDDIKSNSENFVSDAKKKNVIHGATSGTTGTPLSIPQDIESVIREQAFVARHLDWAGYQKGDKRAWIRGDMIVPLEQKTVPFWRYSWFEDLIMLSSFHMTKNALPHYIKAMVDFDVEIIQAYPSSIVTLAKYLESQGEYYPLGLKSIITSSESLSDEDRRVVEDRFQCTVFDWYGLFERVAAIANCEHGRYHVLTDYSHVEFFDAGNGTHEIVGTNFNNKHFPLIRYKTGDHVVLSDETHCPCGRVFPIISKIEGRVGDYLIGEDGQKVHILNHIPKGVDGLLACQFIQNEPRSIVISAVIDETVFDSNQESKLIANTKDRLGQTMSVSINLVNSLDRTRNGKIRQAICTIKE